MKSQTLFSIAALAAACTSQLFSANIASAADHPDYKAVAEKIVGQSAGVKEGDRVVVRGDARDMDLIEEITIAAARRGAEAIQIVGREKAARRYFDEVPAERDSMPLDLSLKLAEVQTVEILIDGQEFPNLLSDVAPSRMMARYKRFMEPYELSLKRGVRRVTLGNGLYPTEANAKSLGLTKDQLAKLFWDGVNVDYSILHSIGARVRAKLAAGKEVHVTNPNGTDFKVRIEGRPVFVSDGVISPDEAAKGGPAAQVWLPAGEVYVTPVPGTAEGKLVFDRVAFEGGAMLDVTITVKAGKLTAHSAKSDAAYDRWKATYDAAPTGKDEFAQVDLGINPSVKIPPGSKLTSWIPAGTVSLGWGDNTWVGGTNACSWAFGGSINGCTLTMDGETLIERGVLKVE